MLTLKINDTKYNVPTSWQDITVQQYINLINYNGSDIGYLATLSNIPEDVLNHCTVEGIVMIRRATGFISDIEALNNFNFHSKELELDIKNEPYENIAFSTQEIKNTMQALYPEETTLTAEQVNVVYFTCAPAIIKAYTEVDILRDPLPRWWGLMVFFLRTIQDFLDDYKELNEPQEDAEDLEEAGAYMLDSMGAYSVILPIAEQYGWSLEYILQSEAQTVYNILLYHRRRNKFQRNLADIKRRTEELRSKTEALQREG